MEKFQIARYGLMQVTALVYGILVCGLAVKLARPAFEAGVPMNDEFYVAMFLRDYGMIFSVIIIIWALIFAYASSSLCSWDISETDMAVSAISICLVITVLTTMIALFASMSGQGDLITSLPKH